MKKRGIKCQSLAIAVISIVGKLWADGKVKKIESDFSRELEGIKSKYQKEQFIYKLQFEMEFKIYKKLWKKLVALNISTQQLLPAVDLSGKSNKEKLEEINKALKDAQKIILENIPFYCPEVYKYAIQMYEISFLEALIHQWKKEPKSTGPDIKDYEKAREKAREVSFLIKKTETAIRNRIYTMEEAKNG